MIKTIKITNFQSHKDSTINLHRGINVLTGSTDNGKTSAVRLLDWVANNRPGGESFRSNWGGETSGSIEKNNGIEVIRKRDKKDNIYILKIDRKEEIFRSFGQGVPEEINQALNILPINMQFQMDSPFMLSQTPGEIARYLNEIVNLKDIDTSGYNLNRVSRENTQRLSNLESQIHTQKESLKEYRWIRSADIKLKKAEKLGEEIKKIQNRKNRLESLLGSIKETNEKLKQFPNVKLIKEKIAHLERLLAQIDELKKDKERLSGSLSAIKKSGDYIKSIGEELANLKEKFNQEFPDICPLCEQEVKK